jgi:hypothetical protein
LPLSRFETPSKCYVQQRSRLVGLPRDVSLRPVSMPKLPKTRYHRPPNELRSGSSFRGVLLLRVPSLYFSRLNAFRLRSRLLKVSSLIATSPRRIHITSRGYQCLHRLVFRPQAFSASRRFDPPLGFAGLFHPTATSRVVAVQGLSLPVQSSDLIDRPCPLAVQQFRPHRSPGCQTRCLDSEASLHTRPRSTRFGVTRPECRSPLRFSVSSRPLSLRSPAPVTQSHPLMTLPPGVFTLTPLGRLQRISTSGLGSSVSF